jgi:uncharacterized protein
MTTPAIYRTTVVHVRRAPVQHRFRYRGYSWYVDIDDLPKPPWWLRPFARFDARDHLRAVSDGIGDDTLRDRVDAVLAEHGLALPGGRITALFQARVLGYVFNPLSLYWCHDDGGVLRAVIAEVHNTYGQRHAYVLPPDESANTAKRMYVSPFNEVAGRYRVTAPEPGASLAVSIVLHRDNEPPFTATLRGNRIRAGAAELARLQLTAPLAPLVGAARIRVQGIGLWLRRVPVVPR